MIKNNKDAKNKLDGIPEIPISVLIKPFVNKQQRRVFSKEEDARLKCLVDHFGKKSWNKIAEMMPFRNPRQCRERYEGYLSPSISREKFSNEEDMIILEKYKEIGPKWTKISKFLIGRNGNQIKNRYYTLKNQKNENNNTTKESREMNIDFKSDDIIFDDFNDFDFFNQNDDLSNDSFFGDNLIYNEFYALF